MKPPERRYQGPIIEYPIGKGVLFGDGDETVHRLYALAIDEGSGDLVILRIEDEDTIPFISYETPADDVVDDVVRGHDFTVTAPATTTTGGRHA